MKLKKLIGKVVELGSKICNCAPVFVHVIMQVMIV